MTLLNLESKDQIMARRKKRAMIRKAERIKSAQLSLFNFEEKKRKKIQYETFSSKAEAIADFQAWIDAGPAPAPEFEIDTPEWRGAIEAGMLF